MTSVLVVCWLNLAMTPCAMAFEVADDCPHCPPAAEQAMAHHGHEAASQADCESMQSDCCDLEAAAVDNRGGKVENQDDLSVAAIPAIWPSLHKLSAVQHDTRPPDPGNYSPPLHKLFCVYLD
jgi:hypothetical protein